MSEATIPMLPEELRSYVLEEMSKNDPAHDSSHVERVIGLTRTLCIAYPAANSYRAQLLALFHDMQDDKLSSHREGETLLEGMLSRGITEEDATFVLRSLPYISYRKHPKLDPEIPIEIRIVQDADRIDAMGAIGIARTFAFGGAKGRPLEESIAHFEDKLLRLYDLLSTEKGKDLAYPRYAFLKEFYTRYKEEQQG